MQLQNLQMLRQLAKEHEADLRRRPIRVARDQSATLLRRWLGGQVVLLGAWIGSEPTMGSAPR
jgi:hypothetical protein